MDTYRVTDVRTASDRAEVVGAGVAIDEVDHGAVVVTATPGEARPPAGARLPVRGRSGARRAGYRAGRRAGQRLSPRRQRLPRLRRDECPGGGHRRAPPEHRQPLQPRSHLRGGELWAVKISDNVQTDEAESEVLFTPSQHAREHLTVEMALYVLSELTGNTEATPA